MHCPYCGGLNQERAAFCVNCGRDLTRQVPNNLQRQQATQIPARPGTTPQNRPTNAQYQPQSRVPTQPFAPRQQVQPQQGYAPASRPAVQTPTAPRQTAQPQQTQTTAQVSRRQTTRSSQPAPVQSAPEPPAPFPPHTIAQFEALLAAGNQAYSVIESDVGDGKKQIVRIVYPRCTGWQQAATLLKALREQQDAKCETILIQGVLPRQAGAGSFTQGQLQFDRNARLGGQVSNRYIVETSDGFASDAVRFVLNG